MRDKKRILKFVFFLVLFVTSPALAEISVVKGGDKMTDETYVGILITSENNRASIYFICDQGEKTPRILFMHNRFLTSSGNKFHLAYRIDKQKMQEHYFFSRPDHKSGRFGIPYKHMYENRFGRSPQLADYYGNTRDFKSAHRNYSAANGRWQSQIYQHFIQDFTKGRKALVRVWDYSEKSYTYSFELEGLKKSLKTISDCYLIK